jgi:acetyl esterase/lipase
LKLLASWAWLVFGAIWAGLALTAVVRWTAREGFTRMFWDSVAIASNELTLPMMLIALLGSTLFWSLGGAQPWPGRAGAWLIGVSMLLLAVALLRSAGEGARLEQALQETLGADYRSRILPERARLLRPEVRFSDWARPLHFDLSGIDIVADIPYGEFGERNRLDVLRPAGPMPSAAPLRPVLLHIHGGGMMTGRKNEAALPLIHHLARSGWVVVTINYRLAPAARWPAQVVDCKRALAWIREHIVEYGGDPGFVAVTGGSAGGNLSTHLAFTPGLAHYQPGFESADTHVQAAVPFYAGYDWDDYPGPEPLKHWIYAQVLPEATRDDARVQADIKPDTYLNAAAPPFFVLTGTHDALVPVEATRRFVQKLRAVARAPVVYAEQLGGNHGYDGQHSLRTEFAVDAVHRFLEFVYSDHLRTYRSAAP